MLTQVASWLLQSVAAKLRLLHDAQEFFLRNAAAALNDAHGSGIDSYFN